MARVSLSLYEEENLPVDLQDEQFTFGKVVYCTLGGFATPDMVCLQLSPAQVDAIAAAIEQYKRKEAA
jgi:hypothetical protein